MYLRSCIRAGDTTTAGGEVQPLRQKCAMTYHGALAGFEGDPVWCPACESHGQAKCVPPLRRDTGPDGRQKILDGDLCLCKCEPPPRLVARLQNVYDSFSAAEIERTNGAAAGWLEYAGLTERFQAEKPAGEHAKLFKFVDSETGEVLANRRYLVGDTVGVMEGYTDRNGCALIKPRLAPGLSVHLIFQSPKGEMACEV